MAILDRVIQMKNQGIGDEDIINQLKAEKISPKEITDALNQAQIKKAVTGESFDFGEMEPSIMQQEGEVEVPVPQPSSKTYTPKTKEVNGYASSQILQQYAPAAPQAPIQEMQEEQYSPEYYSPQGQYETYSDTDTIIEISEQVFDEKISETSNQLESLNKFKTISETKLENIENRLRKIELIIDKLQISILEKVGSYGENLESIKNEMQMMQDSFGKMVNPMAEKNQKIKPKENYAQEISEKEMPPKKFVKNISKK